MILGRRFSVRFPYTTLFRSREPEFAAGAFNDLAADQARGIENVDHRTFGGVENRGVEQHPSEHFFVIHRLCKDRKSTRLNSSHVKISYAVFCLKKKNIKI